MDYMVTYEMLFYIFKLSFASVYSILFEYFRVAGYMQYVSFMVGAISHSIGSFTVKFCYY